MVLSMENCEASEESLMNYTINHFGLDKQL